MTPDGAVVVGRSSPPRHLVPAAAAVMRLTDDGGLDPSLTGDGFATFRLTDTPTTTFQSVTDLGVDGQGRVVAVGNIHGVWTLPDSDRFFIAALLTEPTYAKAAAKAGVGETTLYRWMHNPGFRRAYRNARRELVEAAVGRVQAAAAVETLLNVARTAKRDGDRVRAAVAILDHADRGLVNADTLHGGPDATGPGPTKTADVVEMLATRLRQVEASGLPTAEKARLTASLADAFLRAVGVDVLDKRFEAIQSVMLGRKEKPS